MKRADALAARERALDACDAARGEFCAATDDALRAYRAHTLLVLAAAVGAGLLLVKSRAGESLVKAVSGAASGPGWRLLQQFLRNP